MSNLMQHEQLQRHLDMLLVNDILSQELVIPLTASSNAPSFDISGTATISNLPCPYFFSHRSLRARAFEALRHVPRTRYPASNN
jgi:hypothetical protein